MAKGGRHMVNRDIVSPGVKTSRFVIYVLLIIACFICLFPFLNVFFKSISDEASVLAGEIKLYPKNVHWNAYKYVIHQQKFFQALKNSVVVVVIGTAISLLVNSMTAYVISKKRFRERRIATFLYVFTMIFGAGLIPGYLLVRSLGLYNSMWALILPVVVNPFYMIILKSFIAGISDSLEEAAMIDGAGHLKTFITIILPISKPALASMCLFFAVDLWNDFFRPLIYLVNDNKYTMQLYLRNMLVNTSDMLYTNAIDPLVYGNIAPQSIQNATIFVSIIPILILYPFLQRYFVTGITLGSIKE
jgi:putative aldouronate transport system permease protein